MSCCGNKRATFARELTVGTKRATVSKPGSAEVISRRGTPASSSVPSKMWTEQQYEYTGNTSITVTGPVTGKHYRWTGKGDVRIVDYRDVSGLQQHLSVLKRVK